MRQSKNSSSRKKPGDIWKHLQKRTAKCLATTGHIAGTFGNATSERHNNDTDIQTFNKYYIEISALPRNEVFITNARLNIPVHWEMQCMKCFLSGYLIDDITIVATNWCADCLTGITISFYWPGPIFRHIIPGYHQHHLQIGYDEPPWK